MTARFLLLVDCRRISSILDAKLVKGGASPHLGGRNERPPTLSSPGAATPVGKNRWIPPSTVKREVPVQEDKNDLVFRRVRAILNKLTPEKFDKLSLELLNVGIDSQIILKGIILLIFDKALDEPKYSSLYAQLCHRLCEDAPNFEPGNNSITTFRRLLLNKCQDEFENRSKATEVFDKKDGPLTDEEVEQLHLAKQKMLGNIKFIGELGKLQMLHEGILHRCIKQLLEKKKNTPIQDMAEDLECLCQIMRTVGPRLDTPQAKAWMDKYFERIELFGKNAHLPSRIRFMLQDVVDLRAGKWNPRRGRQENGPRTIIQIRQEAASELGGYTSGNHGRGSSMMGGRMMNGNAGMWKGGHSGLGDLFSAPPGSMVNSIGTGPGVIQTDGYGSTYQNNMGRNRNNQQNQGYNNYNNRRQDMTGSPRNQHNNQNMQQLSPNSQQQQANHYKQQPQANRDLPPRFQRMTVQQTTTIQPTSGGRTSKDEVSLRPVKNFTVLKPTSPNMLPKSAQGPPTIGSFTNLQPKVAGPAVNPVAAKQITIKQISQDKNKSNKEKISKEDMEKAVTALLADFLSNGDYNTAVSTIKQLSVPKMLLPDLLAQLMTETIDKTDEERENVIKLICELKKENLATSDHFMQSLHKVIVKMPDLEEDVPLVRSHVALFAAGAVSEAIISLGELAQPMENGTHHPLFLLTLQHLHTVRDKQWLLTVFNDSKVNLKNMLPEIDQKKERMLEILEDRDLGFLFPLLTIQSELWRQIQTEPSAAAVFKWIRDRVDTNMQKTTGFINILTTCILRHVTGETTLGNSIDVTAVPDKTAVEKEMELLDKLKAVLQRFLHENLELQASALYATQVFCHNNHFPKGMLLRFFMAYYDLEILDEEAFLKWKEEVNDEYPGKGKALFQVNQWLTWLEQAEDESEEEDD
ncbi:eukaryotic translation initiation factor 4 gamma 2-like [Gigantopelta aegis]|uniref:eukaryotic translation initiation factor 4 gamma 2-like n=1 Tax=Gigantopelta aegis TaxID=1735272 RepID=UPI001B88BA80|nr:eukaryotic translation initiation factor 4 gamma 2-like [Gigantopelta aegis]